MLRFDKVRWWADKGSLCYFSITLYNFTECCNPFKKILNCIGFPTQSKVKVWLFAIKSLIYDLLAPSNSSGQLSPVPSPVPGSRGSCHKWEWKEWMGLLLEIKAQSYVHCVLSLIKSHFESHFLPIHLPQPELPCSIIIQGHYIEGPLLAGHQGAEIQSQLCSEFISVFPASCSAQKNDPLWEQGIAVFLILL